MSVLKGWFGESMTRFGLWLYLDRSSYHRFHDVIVPSNSGTTQIDHILVSPFGVFVVETKNMQGWIFGSEHQAKWTQSIYGKKYSFQNPLHQNIRHTKCLAEHLGLDPSLVHSVVFFIGECRFKTPMPSNVLRRGLVGHIRSYTSVLLSDNEVARIVAEITLLKFDRSLTKREHLHSLRVRYESSTVCPKCGSALVERTAKKGPSAGSKFWGCSGYPRCRFTKSG